MKALADIALALPDVTQGVACAGTVLESRTYCRGGKAFLFVSRKDARLKLGASAADATARGFAVGANGWVKLMLDGLPPVKVLAGWIAESHALLAGAAAQPAAATKRAAKKTAAKKKAR